MILNNNRASKTKSTLQRVVRVFVSSTFRDMQAERDELVKHVFPRLRRLCEERGVVWGEVDLRWGITDEQKAEGHVLPLCLEEIRRCRPYFLGILGEYYGWVPDEIPAGLIESEPWLKEHLRCSVTEMEILHGVLNNPDMADHAFFYFRDPTYLERLPDGADMADFRSLAKNDREKLNRLKQRVRRSGLPVRENYPAPQALGALVLRDFKALINKLFPPDDAVEPLDRERQSHEAFARQSARVYLVQPRSFQRLDAHIRSDDPPLAVLGESGSGKSALLANWYLQRQDQAHEELRIVHFIGSTAGSTDWLTMLRRIMGELKQYCNIKQAIPEQADAVRKAFANWLHMAAAKGRVVILLDALDQLEDRDGAPDLVWLPPQLPANIRLVLSTLPGRSLDEINKRNWPILEIAPFSTAERREFIRRYLGWYAKALSRDRCTRIADSANAANPLFLQVLLEELRVFGVHEQLDARIDYYLKAPNIPSLYERVLARYEQDYERNRPGLVGDALSLLWASRRGLAETELRDLLGSENKPLLQADWSSFYLAAEQSFVNRSGLLGFRHDYFRQAVVRRYLRNEESRHTAHSRLAAYFDNPDPGHRDLEEYPWQLARMAAWPRLYAFLSDVSSFEKIWRSDAYDAKYYWARLEENGYSKTEAYANIAAFSQELSGMLAHLMRDTGRLDAALSLFRHQERQCRQAGDTAGLSQALGNSGLILQDKGDKAGAMALFKEQERLCRDLKDSSGLIRAIGNQGLVYSDLGEYDKALALLKESETLCRKTRDRTGLSVSIINQAVIHRNRGNPEAAMALLKQAERLFREMGDKTGLCRVFVNQAVAMQAQGKLEEPVHLLQQTEDLCRELGDTEGLTRALFNQALIYWRKGKLAKAMALLKKGEHLTRNVMKKPNLTANLGLQALILQDQGDVAGAMALYKRQEQLGRDLGDKTAVAIALHAQAVSLWKQGQLDTALAMLKQVENLSRETGQKRGLASAINNQAGILRERKQYAGALALFKQAEELYRVMKDKISVGCSLGGQAGIWEAQGDLEQALILRNKQEQLFREVGVKKLLAECLYAKARLFSEKLNRHAEALPMAREAFDIATANGFTAMTDYLEPLLHAIRTAIPK